MTTDTFTRQDHKDSIGARILWQDNVPHWTRGGKGWAEMRVNAFPNGNWVSIDTVEHSDGYAGGKGHNKRTMLTMSRESARGLRDLLNEVLGEG